MGFISGMYTFCIDLTNTSEGVYESVRVNTARHPEEEDEHLLARALAYCHSYEQDLTFSRGLFEPSEPALWKKDITGAALLWVEIGCPDKKRFLRALKRESQARHRVYFYRPEQVEQFCHFLRGSKTNWIDQVEFFRIENIAESDLSETLRTRTEWSVTIVDESVFIATDSHLFELAIVPTDMWRVFQQHLVSHAT